MSILIENVLAGDRFDAPEKPSAKVALAQNEKSPLESGLNVGTVDLVAGTRFELMTFRL
jgi:hypothetical protein